MHQKKTFRFGGSKKENHRDFVFSFPEEQQERVTVQSTMSHKNAIDLVHSGKYGWTAVAARGFSPGEIVISEAPIFTCDLSHHPQATYLREACAARWSRDHTPDDNNHGDYRDVVENGMLAVWVLDICRLDYDRRKEIVSIFGVLEQWDMMTSDAMCVKRAWNVAEVLKDEEFDECKDFELKQLAEFALIANVHAHAIGGDPGHSALFPLGSKTAHTCGAPNVAFTSSLGGRFCAASGVDDTHVVGTYYALRSLQRGEILYSNYILNTALMTTPTRVQTLYHSRLFICVCDTCTSSVSPTVDRSRGFPCPSCSPGRDDQGRYTFHHQGDHGGAELAGVVHQTGNEWVCDICWGQFEEGECVPEGGEDALEGWVEKTEEEDKREVLDPWDVAQRYNTVAGMLGPAHSATHRLLALHLKTSSHALSTQIHTADPITALSLCAHQLSTFARTRLQVPDAFDSVFATVAYYLTCAAVGLVTISDEEEEVDPEVRAVVRLCVKTAGNLCEEIKETVEERREWIVQHPGTKVYDGIMEINIKLLQIITTPAPTPPSFPRTATELSRTSASLISTMIPQQQQQQQRAWRPRTPSLTRSTEQDKENRAPAPRDKDAEMARLKEFLPDNLLRVRHKKQIRHHSQQKHKTKK